MASERVFYHYKDLEEFQQGMWKIVRGDRRKKNIEAAAALMRDTGRFRDAMMSALTEWPKSCEHNLTAESVNKIAWLGHAGCCIATGSPEENTRVAWHTLSLHEQDEANASARFVLDEWLSRTTAQLGMFDA